MSTLFPDITLRLKDLIEIWEGKLSTLSGDTISAARNSQNYQEEDWDLLVSLWSATHRHIAHVITQTDPEKLNSVWTSTLGEQVSLKDMITDFPRHFKLHILEIEALINTNS